MLHTRVEQLIAKAATEKWTELDLSGMGISELPCSLWELSDLRTLILGKEIFDKENNKETIVGNGITEIPETLAQMTNLEHLNLTGNNLLEIPAAIGHLTELRILNLSYNRITKIPDVIKWCSKLEKLNLKNNPIIDVPDAIQTVSGLNLHSGQIEQSNSLKVQEINLRMTSLRLRDFRGINDLILEFGSTQAIVFIGENGIGKSSILDAISLLLSHFIRWMSRFNEKDLRTPIISDIKNNCRKAILQTFSDFGSRGIHFWELSWSRNNTDQDSFRKAQTIASEIARNATDQNEYNIPILVYYPIDRKIGSFSLDYSERDYNQLNAYSQSLNSAQASFQGFFEWFRIKEDLENEIRANGKIDYKDPSLNAVRQSIYSFVPEFSNLRARRSPLRIVICKNEEELDVQMLSDGEKCLLAMVGDIARRLVIANPGLSNPLEGSGIVLIDEIELHLHPGWQRKVIPGLIHTFPNCQFFITTHSPQVLSHIEPESIYILEKKVNKISVSHPTSSLGKNSDRILEDIMGVPARPQEYKDHLQELYRLIEENQLELARQKILALQVKMGIDEPEFVKAGVLIRRKEILQS
ncbi:MAG: AAA family ATPase [Prochlorotrichaceae cyanobacterium]